MTTKSGVPPKARTIHSCNFRYAGACRMKMSSLEATMAIRQREKNSGKHVPIVAMTANAMTLETRNAVSSQETDGFVAKPISAERVFAAIESLLMDVDAGRALSDTR